MRDDTDGILAPGPAADRGGATLLSATIIPFPGRRTARRSEAGPTAAPLVEDTLDALGVQLGARMNAHGPTALAVLGALAGFAAQQKLMAEGGSAWTQPQRAEHLDRMLIGGSPEAPSLWLRLRHAAHALGAQHLPDPDKLLQSTLRCVGTTQFGQVTLPLEYKLLRQPQEALAEIWHTLALIAAEQCGSFSKLPDLYADCCARRVAIERRAVPPHVALRIVMQAALAMALVEPRRVPGACLKPQCA